MHILLFITPWTEVHVYLKQKLFELNSKTLTLQVSLPQKKPLGNQRAFESSSKTYRLTDAAFAFAVEVSSTTTLDAASVPALIMKDLPFGA